MINAKPQYTVPAPFPYPQPQSNAQTVVMDVMPPTSNAFPVYHEQSLTTTYTTQHGSERSAGVQQASTPPQHELWNKTVTLSRGRAPGDPLARTVNFHCQNTEDLRTCLHGHLASPDSEYSPEHTTIELIFPISAAFSVADPFALTQPGPKLAQAPQAVMPSLYGTPNSTVISIMEAMTPMPDPKDNMKKQRVVAKACVEAVQRADGNRYSFHNNWWSKEDEANRFSYYCNDSILNKGRSANGGAGTIGQTVQKPVYDCKGIIAVKFSAVKQNLQVQYKHVPVHKSYEERAPPPRRGTNRYKLAELHNPESLAKGRKPRRPKAADSVPLKRKRQTSDQTITNTGDEDLTLESTQSLLRLTTPEADRTTTAPAPTRGPYGKYNKKPKCTMCKTQKAKRNGKVPCGNCAERPLFCTHPEETGRNAPDYEIEPATGTTPTQPEPESAPANTAVGLTPRREPKAASAATTKIPRRDLQKELRDAVSEFDMLKVKLAEAEERVSRLEAEKETSGLGSAAWMAKLPTNYTPQTQTATPGWRIMRPVAEAGRSLGSSQPETPRWQAMLPKNYGSMQQQGKGPNNAPAE